MSKKTVYMSIGIPGSGKSSWWEHGIQSGKIPKNAIRINQDSIRKELCGDENDQSKNELVSEVAKSVLLNALANKTEVIYWDNTCTNFYIRKEVIDCAKKANYDVIGIWFDVGLEVAKERNNKRERKVPDDIIEGMHKTLQKEKPDMSEGFEQIIVIS